MNDFYQLSASNLQGQSIDFSDFAGKVVLIVNTASKCGFTPQYEGLQQLHAKYADQGLVIIGFPCNQFGKQEPGGAKEIAQGCLINYGVDFVMMSKIDVNGENAHPVFRHLKSALPGFLTRKIKWNFTKFLVGRDGEAIKRFAPFTKPQQIEGAIIKALKSSNI
ncbi:glutathione peroxidase [Pseudoalteromonas sp. SR44-5]|jgi:glutathione peroxidase|uniref:Glutathione peroxidase n=2 Tax=Pseudoalteromonas TaxID=53246 RepID=A0ABY3FBB4_9GAMM|nr:MULTISPECIES: glutathione peroxidase [Pseudoalteromonas]MBB1292443.1 glutathione peroxidase [Pseudoalteromonas sp. SR41-4]MBB1309187.1 glutathione peroxidase [Pseudoalteromonas sp. SR41-8]MBB1332260.1 glutathione peroxidase [Pseudoalteromonas sp. SR41-6]MBB1340652.1 glutathione peroxidase [Pseudoalteromonas sp. SR45-6]MBB1365596.1 glutathione peroxidase [Pseudoalteromonas sp. SR44-5]|tara:strand:- start:5182 stop:5673 length:492 start_codon:yes stop_codon:yes gene_type:complete